MKITQIEFCNYKAFYCMGEDNIIYIPEGRNMLLYGENGSGKSSIYEGLRNLFLASDITSGEANFSRHLAVDESITTGEGADMKTELVPAFIKINLDDFAGNTKEVIYGSDGNVEGDADIFEATKYNSFLSYRELLKTYLIRDVNNSFEFQTNLAKLIIKDILAQAVNVGTNKTYIQNYNELWVKGKGTRPNRAEKEEIVQKFDIGFKKDIADFNLVLNELLQYFFSDLKIELIVIDSYIEYEFQNFPVFQIALKCWLNGMDTSKNDESHLTILNEARLSALALCIFFSGIIIKNKATTKIKFLFFDDVFIGLDTSNRIPLLKILSEFKNIEWKEDTNADTGLIENQIQRNEDGSIKKKNSPFFEDYQIFLTTYDKNWFEVSRQYFDSYSKTKWQYIELYIDDISYDFDVPFILPYQSKLEKAEDYLITHDYRACATYLRSLCEEELQRILPNYLKVSTQTNQQGNLETKELNLNDLLINFEKFCLLENIPFDDFKFLRVHKNHILNTLSHNDIHSPIYKRELLETLQSIKNLSLIQFSEVPNKIKDFSIILKVNNGNEISVRFKRKDSIRIIIFKENYLISNNCNCELESTECNGDIKDFNQNFKSIKEIYIEVCKTYEIEPNHNLFHVIFKRIRNNEQETQSLAQIIGIS